MHEGAAQLLDEMLRNALEGVSSLEIRCHSGAIERKEWEFEFISH
jgi:hypothetical protein